MAQHSKHASTARSFRQSTIFDWEVEPALERKRAYVPSSGDFRPRAFGARSSSGQARFNVVLASLILFLVVSVSGLLGMVHLFHR